MVAGTHQEIHSQHREWLTDIAMWQDDLDLWRNEYHTALTDVARLEAALRASVRALNEHLEGVVAHNEHLAEHEHLVGRFEHGDHIEELDLLTLTKAHEQEAREHVRQAERHELIKKRHHALMAHWYLLLKEMLTPAEGKARADVDEVSTMHAS
jgi:hypothetical protein